jgi:hypothetical protein
MLFSIAFICIFSYAAYGQDTSSCFPPCRKGFICIHGHCIEQCNPPCPTGFRCAENGDCIPVEQTAPTLSVPTIPKKVHKHTGFYLSINLGVAGGSNITSGFPSSDTVQKISLSSAGEQLSFSIGIAIRENMIIYADIPSAVMLINPSQKIDGVPQPKPDNYSSVALGEYLIGIGGIYYFMPYDLFASGTIGVALSDLNINKSVVNNTGQTISETVDLTSDAGFGFRLRAGKEWWVSNRWGLGAAGFFQFSTYGSGAIYSISGQMYSIMSGLSFSATFN